MNFNADGDKILTGSFDGTAIVTTIILRFGTLNQESQFMFYKDTQVKYPALNFSLEDTCVGLLQLIRHVVFGMLEQVSVCLYFEDTLTKSLTLTSMQLELVW